MEDDGDDKDDNKRRTRNLSEKKRRDQFNVLVHELSSLIAVNNRKMDKTTVLKSTISFLKNHNEVMVRSRVHDVHDGWKPSFLANEEFTYLILEAMEGFVLVFSGNGQIIYVSEGIMSLLGHKPMDMSNRSIYDLIPDIDRQQIYRVIHHSTSLDPDQLNNDDYNEVKFRCHLKRSVDMKDKAMYELVDFTGRVRRNTDISDGHGFQPDQDSRILLVCIGRLHTPHLIRDETLLDSSRCEFSSRHSLEWKFLFLDHRAPPIIGYLPFEVLGTSGYDYYHFDDLDKVIHCHETLMEKGELTSCYYRFLTKGQQWIWLQTRFYITYHQWNSKPEFVVCNHRVVSYDDMLRNTKKEMVDEDVSEMDNSSQRTVKESPSDDNLPQESPSYFSDNNDTYSYQQLTPQGKSSHGSSTSNGGTFATAGSSNDWARELRRYTDSVSLSSGSRPSHQEHHRGGLAPQHSIGVQYLEPMQYVGLTNSSTIPTTVFPAMSVPVILDSSALPLHDHVQAQEQLQRKHEKLQQMIMLQQEELRQVKEQLLLARFGMLQPLIPVPASYTIAADSQGSEPRLAPPLLLEPGRSDAYDAPTQAPLVNNYMPHLPQ